MAIQTSIQPFTLWRNVGFGVLCLVFALWGWYDYQYKIPRETDDLARYTELGNAIGELEKKGNLTPEETQALAEKTAEKSAISKRYGNGTPPAHATYDRAMQLWLYIVGCGVMGVPMFAWPLLRTSMRPYRLDDQGVLHTPDGVYGPDEIEDIDMSRWCSPTGDRRSTWTAKVVLKNGKRILLDDHDHRNMHMIIGAIAHRLHPDQWTAAARRVEAKPDTGASEPAKA
jgi:hypothetical protein